MYTDLWGKFACILPIKIVEGLQKARILYDGGLSDKEVQLDIEEYVNEIFNYVEGKI